VAHSPDAPFYNLDATIGGRQPRRMRPVAVSDRASFSPMSIRSGRHRAQYRADLMPAMWRGRAGQNRRG